MPTPPPSWLLKGATREALEAEGANLRRASVATDVRAWELRRERGLSVVQVAARLGLTARTVRKMLARERARRVTAGLPVPEMKDQEKREGPVLSPRWPT